MEGNVKPAVLLINCYQAKDDKLIADYTHWLEPLFDIRQVRLDELSSTKIDADAIVISGSERSLINESL
ncbi:hypothetical protein GF359_05805, partial [candidate division WOR-3 bacterium]|nr:hypothetical protein [candidate division WOR-3 bacterium]MBD3364712.1 hypothetical protein [candidate division WOR-3 bacterium]